MIRNMRVCNYLYSRTHCWGGVKAGRGPGRGPGRGRKGVKAGRGRGRGPK